MKEKRGLSRHLEMVISFVIFTGFLLFLFVYIKPVNQNTLSDSVLLHIDDYFSKNAGTNLTVIFLKVNSDITDCFSVSFNAIADGHSLARSALNGEKIPSSYNQNKLTVYPESENSFYILISDEFPGTSLLECNPPSEYDIGSIETDFIISNRSLYELKKEYEKDYENLKEKMSIPETMDFSIQSSDNEFVLEKQIPENTQVSARSNLYKVLYSDGSIKNKEFIFKAW